MSKRWKEKADPAKHLDLMSAASIGGVCIRKTVKWVYFVKECSFILSICESGTVRRSHRIF
jgi:bacteriorhodopsin